MLHAIARTEVQILSALHQRVSDIFRNVCPANRIAEEFLRSRHRGARLDSFIRRSVPPRRSLERFLEHPCDRRRHRYPKNVPKKPF